MTRKEMEKSLRRQFIVDAAEELFREKGFEATQMDEIARHAEFSKTTLYKYFTSKDELALLVYRNLHSKKMEYLKQATEEHDNAVDRLQALGKAYYSFFVAHPDYLRFQLYWDYRGLNKRNIRPNVIEDTTDVISEDVDYFCDILQRGIQDGTLRSDLDVRKTLDLFYLTLRCVMNQILFISSDTSLGSFIPSEEDDYSLFLNLFIDSFRAS
jgi:AcrR family transcriptional regulator